jgi:hypothetical protein
MDEDGSVTIDASGKAFEEAAALLMINDATPFILMTRTRRREVMREFSFQFFSVPKLKNVSNGGAKSAAGLFALVV